MTTGITADVEELIELKKQARWRRWPNEKPQDEEKCFLWDDDSIVVFESNLECENEEGEKIGFSDCWGREYGDPECCHEGDLWLPLSVLDALPKPEGGE